MHKVIAIDGPSGAGKTTIAKLIAEKLRFEYLDTGALYRAVAVALRNNGIVQSDSDDKIKDVLSTISINFKDGKVYVNNKDITGDIRSTEVDHYSSVFSARKIVREYLLDVQRNAALKNALVVEGRDTTTVVFPDAKKKIFLDASVEERAKRRCKQYREKGIDINIEESLKSIIDRDMRDANRDIAPLKIAADALVIDSSDLSVEQVLEKIFEYIKIDL
ncbi:MAG: (d)CMP kinase [Nitrospirae bacterium]|nr:(d)CMP kinase [Nitrospirota bacterium]